MLAGDILRLSARRHPSKLALICDDRRMTYGELDGACNRFANAVLGLGLTKGETVAVMCPNIIEYAIVHFGNARTGCQSVHLSTMYGTDELIHILNQTRARLLVVDDGCQAGIEAVRDRLDHLERIVVVGQPTIAGAITFEQFLTGASVQPPGVALADSDPLGMTFTGGTTGLPKGAAVSHRARYVSAYTVVMEHELTGEDVVAMVTPLYHAVGLMIWFQAAVLAGCTCVLRPSWDAPRFIEDCARHRITAAFLVPLQLRAILDAENFDADKLATLRKIGSGGAPVPGDMIALGRARLAGVRLVDHYGQSETGPLTILKPWHPADKNGSIGLPAVGVDLKVVDPAGNEVAPGEIGEIIVAGEFMFEGYFENPEETAAYFRSGDGWGWTGDLATVDEDGFITLAGRSKDMIVSGGVNVYPREVEIVLEHHEGVTDCTVFGIPDETWGEALVAYVVPRAGHSETPETLIDYCGSRLARLKRPRDLVLVDEIPKTPAGKVQKLKLRDEYLVRISAGEGT
jgi:acyl-CoA synthetase (AMP-forming)/AMP-acid ligase II